MVNEIRSTEPYNEIVKIKITNKRMTSLRQFLMIVFSIIFYIIKQML